MQLFGPWLPDLPSYRAAGLQTARNVVPQTDMSYGPFADLVEQTPALDAPCVGLLSARNSAGSVAVFAGTGNGLFRLDPQETDGIEAWSDGTYWTDATGWLTELLSGNDWTNISKAGGYGLAENERWTFLPFGMRLIAGGSLASAIQSYDMTSVAEFADLGSGLPRGLYMAVVAGRLMLANTWDAVNGNQRRRVWWSARNNPASFPTPGTIDAAEVESDYQDLEGGGDLMGILPSVGGADAAVFGERRIWTMNDIGPPAFFQIDAKEQGMGASVPGSIVGVGNVAFYWSRDGIFLFDGASSKPVGADKVNQFLLDDFEETKRSLVWAAQDLRRNLVLWAYPTGANETAADRLLVYNWKTGNFSFVELGVQVLSPVETRGYTLEELDAFGNMDTLPFSLDANELKGGYQYLAAVTTGNRVASFSGSPLEAEVETADIPFPGGNRAFYRGARVYTDAAGVQARLRYRDSLSDSLEDKSWRTASADYKIHDRRNARFIRVGVKVPAGTDWTHLQGYDIDARPGGRV